MIYKVLIIPLTFLFVLGIFLGKTKAEDKTTQYEQVFLELINQAREDPKAMTTNLGMDVESLVQERPELKYILNKELLSLSFNEKLYQVASANTQDMLNNNYQGHVSPDGKNYEELIKAAGYEPVIAEEALGIILFRNFIKPETALLDIFKQIFTDELHQNPPFAFKLLNPQVRDIGISIRTGKFAIDGKYRNAYIVACVFASNKNYLIEQGLHQFINEARQEPMAAIQGAGLNLDTVQNNLGEQKDILQGDIPPLAWNVKLQEAAKSHVQDMYEKDYLDIDSLQGTDPTERYSAHGYESKISGQYVRLMEVDSSTSWKEITRDIFFDLIKEEVELSEEGKPTIFNPNLSEVGIGINRVDISGEDKSNKSLFWVSVDFAQPEEERYYLLGRIYESDQDKDKFTFNLIKQDIKILLDIPTNTFIALEQSDMLGRYQVALPWFNHPFSYAQVGLHDVDGNILQEERIYINNANQRIEHLITFVSEN